MEFVSFALLYHPIATLIHVFIELNVKRSRRPLYVECITRAVHVYVYMHVCEGRDEVKSMQMRMLDQAIVLCKWFIVNMQSIVSGKNLISTNTRDNKARNNMDSSS